MRKKQKRIDIWVDRHRKVLILPCSGLTELFQVCRFPDSLLKELRAEAAGKSQTNEIQDSLFQD
jgi:hypothetical protein